MYVQRDSIIQRENDVQKQDFLQKDNAEEPIVVSKKQIQVQVDTVSKTESTSPEEVNCAYKV